MWFYLHLKICNNSLSVCYLGDIRLTGTASNVSKGNVELCIANGFNAICGNVWSSNDTVLKWFADSWDSTTVCSCYTQF